MGITTGYINSDGVDIGSKLVEKSYLIDVYPYLVDQYRFAGLYVWGNNTYAQLGDNTLSDKSSPVQTVAYGTNWKQMDNGLFHSAAIKTDGTLWLWGRNTYGQLGDNTRTSKSSPVQTVAFGTNWKQVSVSRTYYHSTAIKTDGTLWCWGYNASGQLGDNSVTNKSSPVQTVAFGANWKLVSAGGYYTSAIKTDGTLWSWGWNNYGQLGDNTTTKKSSPVQTVAYGTNWKQVSSGTNHVSAIKTDGTLWTWGYNIYGQLGDNSVTAKSSPVQTVAFGSNWKSLATNMTQHSAAIKTDGTLWLWGLNNNGQLGDNTVANKSSPVQTVAYGTNWKQVSVGGSLFSAAIKTDGTLWLWGSNSYGQLGDSSTFRKSSPIQTVAYGTNWKQVSSGGISTLAIRDDSEDLW